MLPRDQATRWNSWYLMLDVALQKDMRDALNAFIARYPECEKGTLSFEDWKTLDLTHEFLQPFCEVTLETEGRSDSIDEVYT